MKPEMGNSVQVSIKSAPILFDATHEAQNNFEFPPQFQFLGQQDVASNGNAGCYMQVIRKTSIS